MALPHAGPPDPRRDADAIRAAVARFGHEVAPQMRGDGRSEDRLRVPVHNLLKALGASLGRDVVVHHEVTLPELSSRPDLAIDTAGGRVGYIELKTPGRRVPENWNATSHDLRQWKKLCDLPNLIYTDGTFWALYRKGVLAGQVAALSGDLAQARDRLAPADDEFERLIHEFLVWKPDRPTTLHGVVGEVAPLCRLLREQVAETMAHERSSPGRRPFTTLAAEWRDTLFPNLDERDFADAYAQAVTFSLLLARVDGIVFEGRSLSDIAQQLSKLHSLMGEALSILANPKWVEHLSVVETLRRVVGNVDWDEVGLGESETYALLYETFLKKYDPKLRRKSGTYYTPDRVARAMVGFADQLLKTRLNKTRGFADGDVTVVDPAMGTGTFLVEIIDSVVATLRRERDSDAVPEAHLRELFAERLAGFELQAAPYAVAELRLHHTLKSRYGVELPREEVRFLSNALDDPDTLPLPYGQLYDVLQEARQGANRIKRDEPVMVVVGNPPWRERARGEAPWLEAPRDPRIVPVDLRARPSLDEFRAPGQGKREFNLSNMWTFFWRWATWKIFDSDPANPAGIVALITPKPYVTSESHAGMRRYLRETADEGWIIDVSPERFQPDVSTRLFPEVQQPICFGIFARYGQVDRETPACVHHTVVTGLRERKVEQLLQMQLDSGEWRDCPTGWEAPFQPIDPAWIPYPKLVDLLPWSRTGVNSNRNWVWAPDRETLRRRWARLIHTTEARKSEYFKETPDRSLNRAFRAVPGVPSGELPLGEETNEEPFTVPAAFRSFDRQFLILDRRVVDRPRPELWQVWSEAQVYVSEQHAHPIRAGPGLIFSALVPNVHHFDGRGGRVLPLYLDREGRPNVATSLLTKLGSFIGTPVSAEGLLAYVAAVVAHPGYTRRFREELATPGIRVPITAKAELWREAVGIGREVIWLHTYGERYVDEAAGRPCATPRLPEKQRPRFTHPIPTSDHLMPNEIHYDPETETLTIGEETLLGGPGRVERVSPAVWDYAVGGLRVVYHWFSYRKRKPSRKRRTSCLDGTNPTRWTSEFDDELFNLLNVLGRCVALEPRQADLLDRICAGPMITVGDLTREGVLPVPAACRKPPQQSRQERILSPDASDDPLA